MWREWDASHGRGLAEKACEIHTKCWPRISVSSHSAVLGIMWESHQGPALFLDFISAPNCAIACFFLSMDGLLAIALMNNGEDSGDARLLVSEILQHLAAIGAMACCRITSQHSMHRADHGLPAHKHNVIL